MFQPTLAQCTKHANLPPTSDSSHIVLMVLDSAAQAKKPRQVCHQAVTN